MLKINQITADAKQKHTLVLDDGSNLILRLYFSDLQQSWFIEELSYEDITINCMRIGCSFNLLNQFKNKLPFGLACLAKNQREPTLQEDFLSGNAELFILTEEEVQQYSEFLSG